MDKSELMNFIDAMVAGDDETSKSVLSKYIQHKSKAILGLSENEESTETALSESVRERANKLMELLESFSGNRWRLGGNDVVYVDNKKVGYVRYAANPHDDDDSAGQMVLVDLNGKSIVIPDNNVEVLAQTIVDKFLGGKDS